MWATLAWTLAMLLCDGERIIEICYSTYTEHVGRNSCYVQIFKRPYSAAVNGLVWAERVETFQELKHCTAQISRCVFFCWTSAEIHEYGRLPGVIVLTGASVSTNHSFIVYAIQILPSRPLYCNSFFVRALAARVPVAGKWLLQFAFADMETMEAFKCGTKSRQTSVRVSRSPVRSRWYHGPAFLLLRSQSREHFSEAFGS